MKRRRGDKPTPAQAQAMLNNGCLRSFAGLRRMLTLAGHQRVAAIIQSIELDFRSDLKRKEK